MDPEIIFKYFSQLTEAQKQQFGRLGKLYEEWNSQINVISRKDMDSFYERHVLHSLGIAKVMDFQPETRVLDIGTGGGFPGIPLAILYPETDFMLVDSIGKKIKVVQAVAEALDLKNVKAQQVRAEELKEKFHFVVSRAVTSMPKFLTWLRGKFERESFNQFPNGVLYLKGGDLTEELKGIRHKMFDLPTYFEEAFFETKKVVYIAANQIK